MYVFCLRDPVVAMVVEFETRETDTNGRARHAGLSTQQPIGVVLEQRNTNATGGWTGGGTVGV